MPSTEPRANIRHEIIDPTECDQQAVAALVTAAALVAIADRHIDTIEREEAVRYINDRQLVPTMTGACIGSLFDDRARRLEQLDFADFAIDALRPVSGLSLAPDVIEIAERVAAADGQVHSHELQAIRLIRLVTMSLSKSKVVTSSRGSPRSK